MFDQYIKKILATACAFLLISLGVLSNETKANAQGNASLFLSPSSGSHTVNSTFTVRVSVNAGGTPINAADGTLQFDKSLLSVTNVSKSGSIFSLWVSDPSFSNANGTIRFEGGNPSPYTGNAGTIITVTFKALKEGTAAVSFTSGNVLAADGKGTNVTGSLGRGTYTITPAATTPPPTVTPPTTAPVSGSTLTAIIDSPTHPEEEQWYNNSSPELEWLLPQSVTGVSVYFSDSPTSNPGTQSDGLISTQNYEDIEDGEWYFHTRWLNTAGWGPTTHRKILIDTAPPQPFNVEVDQKGRKDASPILKFSTTDSLSGIDYYEIIVSGSEPIKIAAADWSPDGFQLPSLSPQTHTVAVRAYDRAGNFSESTVEITVEGILSAEIEEFSDVIREGIPLILRGFAAPLSRVKVRVESEDGSAREFKTLSDERGNWFLVIEGLEAGTYEFSAKTVLLQPVGPDFNIAAFQEGEESIFSQPVTKEVQAPYFFLLYGWILVSGLMLVIFILIAIIWLLLWYHRKRRDEEQDRLREEVADVKDETREVFRALREEVEEQVRYLDGRPSLTKSEERVLERLQNALDISEELLKKEVTDVEKIANQKN